MLSHHGYVLRQLARAVASPLGNLPRKCRRKATRRAVWIFSMLWLILVTVPASRRSRRTGREATNAGQSLIAYCGPAAIPEDLWARWNADPLLIAALVALAVVVGRGRAADARAGWGGDRAAGAGLRLAALRARLGAVLGAGAAPCAAGRRRGAAPRAGLSAAAPGLAAARRAGRGARGHPVALACARALCLGPRQRAGLLADAGLAARQRLAPVAGDPHAGDAARCRRWLRWSRRSGRWGSWAR